MSVPTPAAKKSLWVIYVVAFDDTGEPEECRIEPYVGKEQIERVQHAEMHAVLRGGHAVATVQGSETDAEHARAHVEAEVLRR